MYHWLFKDQSGTWKVMVRIWIVLAFVVVYLAGHGWMDNQAWLGKGSKKGMVSMI